MLHWLTAPEREAETASRDRTSTHQRDAPLAINRTIISAFVLNISGKKNVSFRLLIEDQLARRLFSNFLLTLIYQYKTRVNCLIPWKEIKIYPFVCIRLCHSQVSNTQREYCEKSFWHSPVKALSLMKWFKRTHAGWQRGKHWPHSGHECQNKCSTAVLLW